MKCGGRKDVLTHQKKLTKKIIIRNASASNLVISNDDEGIYSLSQLRYGMCGLVHPPSAFKPKRLCHYSYSKCTSFLRNLSKTTNICTIRNANTNAVHTIQLLALPLRQLALPLSQYRPPCQQSQIPCQRLKRHQQHLPGSPLRRACQCQVLPLLRVLSLHPARSAASVSHLIK